ncbi:aldo/keto reductase [Candidatus Leptofilum sp.]|uniref:aldo/keto reductase n=1 Tax=Candidatus Leptofilum sp. TaxID=3241576 RepID=UPI003B59277B
MQKRKLGKLDEWITPLGFGCAAIGGFYTRAGQVASRGKVDDDESIRAIHAALAAGIQLFDVGNIYGAGHAERMLGRALVGRRHEAILHIKFGASFDEVTRAQIDYDGEITPAMIRRSLEGSLRRLRTDVIDIFQFQRGNYPIEQLPEIIDVLHALINEGKIRAYCYGTRNIEQLRPFVEAPHCATVITNHNVLMDAPDLLDFLAANGVALLAGVPLFMGLLAGSYSAKTKFDTEDLRANWNLDAGCLAEVRQQVELLRPFLTSGGRTMVQGALAWLWAWHEITIPVVGFRTAVQVEQSAKALQHGMLDQETMNTIANAKK